MTFDEIGRLGERRASFLSGHRELAIRLAIASVASIVTAFALTAVDVRERSPQTAVEASSGPTPPEWPARELPDEWTWEPEAVPYQQMFRSERDLPPQSRWDRLLRDSRR